MAPDGTSWMTTTVCSCARTSANARSTHPTGSAQSRGTLFHNTQVCLAANQIIDRSAVKAPSVQLSLGAPRAEQEAFAGEFPQNVVRRGDFGDGLLLTQLAEWSAVGQRVIAHPVTVPNHSSEQATGDCVSVDAVGDDEKDRPE